MGREIDKLSHFTIANAKKWGTYSDGAGLYLQVSKWGTKSWVFRYMLHGERHQMGLGSLHTVSLVEARARARQYRQIILDGKDPLELKREAIVAKKLAKARMKTFAECADEYIKAKVTDTAMRNDKHRKQWRESLEQYAFPAIGDLPVASIDTPLVLKVLQPIWDRIPETASRLRGRIERILAFATVREYRRGDNPARWRGHLKEMFAERSKQQHLAALPFDQLPAFMAELRNTDTVAARALEFTILTAARRGEVINAVWSEIDLDAKAWTVPAERMKAGEEHVVPLSDRAVEILKSAPGSEGRIFAISSTAMWSLTKAMAGREYTVHGFRSTFRDWAGDRTAYPHDVIEFALAHGIPDKASAAYRRYRALDKRRRLMADWARYCYSPPVISGEVVSLHACEA
jgi:integrase